MRNWLAPVASTGAGQMADWSRSRSARPAAILERSLRATSLPPSGGVARDAARGSIQKLISTD